MNRNNEDAYTRKERYYLERHAAYKSSNSTSHTGVNVDGSCLSSMDSECFAFSRTYNTTIFVFHLLGIQIIPILHSPQIS